MKVRYRPLGPDGIRKAVEHLAAQPILGPRYGSLIEHLPAAISQALRDDCVTVNVFEESEGFATTFLGIGVACVHETLHDMT